MNDNNVTKKLNLKKENCLLTCSDLGFDQNRANYLRLSHVTFKRIDCQTGAYRCGTGQHAPFPACDGPPRLRLSLSSIQNIYSYNI